jgi:hypothetical protein
VGDAAGQPGHGSFDGVELVQDAGQVVDPDAPDERRARVVGGEAGRGGVEVVRLDDDEAAGKQKEAEIRFIVDGACRYGGQQWGEGTYLYLPPGAETGAFSTERGATFFTISLPLINEFAARQRDKEHARVAAE